jgi:hypothetical protein
MDMAAERGIFLHFVNQAAFLDKAVFSIWGNRRLRSPTLLQVGPSRAIGGPKRMYARMLSGQCSVTGNPFELKYGKLRSYENVPPFRLTVRSDRMPLSGAQVAMISSALFRSGFRSHIANLEFTFDVTNYPFTYFRHRLFTRARSVVELGSDGHGTFYAGRPRSPWQLRVYEKTQSLVRVEYVLRRAFLSANGIERVDDILRLRDVNIWALASFQDFHEERLAEALAKVPDGWGKDLLSETPRHWPLQLLTAALRGRCGIDPNGMLHRSDAQRLLREMQDNMLW